MKLEGQSVRHAVHKDTRLSAACFLAGESSNNFWHAFLCIRVAPYVRYPKVLALNQATQFTSTEWLYLSWAAGTSIKPSGVESHDAFSVVIRYHAYLRWIYNKSRSSTPLLPIKVALGLFIRAADDTACPSTLVPSLLVFSFLLRLPIRPTYLPAHVERMKAAVAKRQERKEKIELNFDTNWCFCRKRHLAVWL